MRRRTLHRRDGDAGVDVDAPGVLQLTVGEVQPDRPPALLRDPARALAGPAAHLEHVAVGHVAEHSGDLLGQPLRPPHEPRIAQEGAVGRLVLVGVPVPVGSIRPPRLRLVDRPPFHAHRRVRPRLLHVEQTIGRPQPSSAIRSSTQATTSAS